MKIFNINKKYLNLLPHIIIWLIVFSLPYLLMSPHNVNGKPDPIGNRFFILNSLTGILWVILFYFNAHVLIPRFVYRKKYVVYTALLLCIFAIIMLIHYTIFRLLIQMPFRISAGIGFNTPAFILDVAISFTYKMLNDRFAMEKLTAEKHEQNMKTELSFLRSQISPHFIFNVLNNLVALIRMKSDELEPTVMKLSALMQYMLYETDEEKVPLKLEAEYLQNYIDLQMQRFGAKVKINKEIAISDDFLSIEPMLLIPFVENAFKHGVGLIKDPEIIIKLQVLDNELHFNVRNKYNPLSIETKDKSSGIGLVNVTRRLSLLYPEKHSLLINKDNDFFNVSLQITLANA